MTMNGDPRVFLASLTNPFTRALAIVVGAGVLVALFALGLMFFAVFAGIALVSGLVLATRLWWLNRKLGAGTTTLSKRDNPLDAEYRVISVSRTFKRDPKDL